MPETFRLAETFRIQRARPWLGTIATVQAEFRVETTTGIEEAFAAIARVHRLMNYFDGKSDLARFHAVPAGQAVTLDSLTLQVIDAALQLARLSHGLFDPALAGESVARGVRPAPPDACYDVDDTRGGRWSDLVRDGDTVLAARPLWLDLSGIAKGFAVDQALAALRVSGAIQATVNIGGDMAVFGPAAARVTLRTEADSAPEIDIENMAVASSGGAADRVATRHVDGRGGLVDPHAFAAVLAPTCLAADGLTKVMLAAQDVDLVLLSRYRARALRHDPIGGWEIFGEDHG